MASFYAELRVSGYTYPVPHCTYAFSQATDGRGRVVAKVRHGSIELTLDVPDDDFLLAWAAAPYKPLAGCVVFFQDQGGPALETLSWEVGHCVGYQEQFESGQTGQGAYVCHVTITAEKLTLQPGGPGTYTPPAPGSHGQPGQVALLGQSPLGPEVLTPFVPIAMDAIITAAGPVLAPFVAVAATGALAVAAVLGLILLTTTPAHAPGRPMPVVSPDELRLRALVAKQATGTLTPDEEAELIALLAKVKGIRIKSLSDLNVVGTYKKKLQGLPGFHFEDLTYVKRSQADTDALRRKFGSSVRAKFAKKIGTDPTYVAELRAAGFDDKMLEALRDGNVPTGYQVHHQLPLDDGGDNSFGNLILIKQTPYHSVITGYQKTNTGKLQPGESKQLPWPIYKGSITYPPQKTP